MTKTQPHNFTPPAPSMLAALPGTHASMPVTGTFDAASGNHVFGCTDASLQQHGVTETSAPAPFAAPSSVICPAQARRALLRRCLPRDDQLLGVAADPAPDLAGTEEPAQGAGFYAKQIRSLHGDRCVIRV